MDFAEGAMTLIVEKQDTFWATKGLKRLRI
jgi:hypothetical protein